MIAELFQRRKSLFYSLFIMQLAILTSTTCVLAADLFVQSVKAPILSAPSLGSSKVAEATKGDSLKELEKKGDWYRVGHNNSTGWVSRLLVGPKPPAGKVSVLEETGEKLETGARKRASAFTTAAAARGLAEERARISDKFRVDYNALDVMEGINISDEEALRFVNQGVGR